MKKHKGKSMIADKSKPALESAGFIVSQAQMSLDLKMVPYDLWGTTAHVLMLIKQEIIGKKQGKAILTALKKLEGELGAGTFVIDPGKGAQLTLEAKIVEKVGDIGYSVHTGRSRNDQVMVTEMLYLRDAVIHLVKDFVPVLNTLLSLAKEHQKTVMPGYTHMQPAKPTTFGQWSLSFLYGFLRAIKHLSYLYEAYDMNPLGACESYGTSWRLDRDFTTKLLGFAKPWTLPQDAVSSRGFVQLGYLTGFKELSLVASKLAQDLLLFTTFEFGMIALGEEVAQRMHPITGSSVMAQKKNPDVLELIRATAPQVAGFESIVGNLLSGLPMGYNRDTREVKEYIDLGISKTSAMVKALEKVLTTIKVDATRMQQLVEANYSMTTDLADAISQKSGVAYRIMYKIVGAVVDAAIKDGKLLSQMTAGEIIEQAKAYGVSLTLTDADVEWALDPAVAIAKRLHVGGSGKKPMQKALSEAKQEIKNLSTWIIKQDKTIAQAKSATIKAAVSMKGEV